MLVITAESFEWVNASAPFPPEDKIQMLVGGSWFFFLCDRDFEIVEVLTFASSQIVPNEYSFQDR